MKVIIAGSRSCTEYKYIEKAMEESGLSPSEVVSGTAAGADRLGEEWARKHGVSVKIFPANWAKYGRSAGMKRNAEMAEYADALVAVWDGRSRGTMGMISIAKFKGLEVFVYRFGE